MMPGWVDLLCTALNVIALVALVGAIIYALTMPDKLTALVIAVFAVALFCTIAQMKD